MTFVYVSVGVCQSEDTVVCFGAKPTQRACARDYLRDRKMTREGRTKEDIEQKKTVYRKGQTREESRS